MFHGPFCPRSTLPFENLVIVPFALMFEFRSVGYLPVAAIFVKDPVLPALSHLSETVAVES